MENSFLQAVNTTATRSNFLAFRCQRKKRMQEFYYDQIDHWLEIMPFFDVLIYGIGGIAILVIDMALMFQTYRSLSEAACGNADLIALPLGLGLAAISIVTSERLVHCYTSGPLFKWEVYKRKLGSMDLALYNHSFRRTESIKAFAIQLGFFLAALISMLVIRSILAENTDSAIEKVEWYMAVFGIAFALCSVYVGAYVSHLFLFCYWKVRVALLDRQVNSLICQVSTADGFVLMAWRNSGTPNNLPHNIAESLIRSLFRKPNRSYCDPVQFFEYESFTQQFPGFLLPPSQN